MPGNSNPLQCVAIGTMLSPDIATDENHVLTTSYCQTICAHVAALGQPVLASCSPFLHCPSGSARAASPTFANATANPARRRGRAGTCGCGVSDGACVVTFTQVPMLANVAYRAGRVLTCGGCAPGSSRSDDDDDC